MANVFKITGPSPPLPIIGCHITLNTIERDRLYTLLYCLEAGGQLCHQMANSGAVLVESMRVKLNMTNGAYNVRICDPSDLKHAE